MSAIEMSWPAVLLGLRVGVVVLLYLFLFAAFRALRTDLRPVALPAERGRRATTAAEDDAFEEVATPPASEEDGEAEPSDSSLRSRRSVAPQRRALSMQVAIPAAAAALVLVLGSFAALVARDPAGSTTPTSENAPFGPPTATPAPGRVTVGLAATEDSQVRVTVDGVVQFDGTLQARGSQTWEGGERIQVWTDNGRKLHLSVNGEDLGPYSPAMGHPDWNRIDFGFWPGWTS